MNFSFSFELMKRSSWCKTATMLKSRQMLFKKGKCASEKLRFPRGSGAQHVPGDPSLGQGELERRRSDEDLPRTAELEKRVQWLEAERVRLLQLSRNKSSRRLSVAQHRSDTTVDADGAINRNKKSSKHAAEDGNGVWERAEKYFSVRVTLPSDKENQRQGEEDQERSFCELLGISLGMSKTANNRLVVREFIRDENGNPGLIEGCGHVGVDDILVGVDGKPMKSVAELNGFLRKIQRHQLTLDFSRKLSKQVAKGDPKDLKQASERIAFLEEELKFARTEYARLDIGALESLQLMLDDSRMESKRLQVDLRKLRQLEAEWQVDEELRRKYAIKEQECRSLLNQLIDLKGAIRVFVRGRPIDYSDPSQMTSSHQVLHFPHERGLELSDLTSGDVPERTWNFDAVFGPESTQKQVYGEIEPLVYSVVDGYNACVFAYGQTGSGKTYTMDGPEHDRGIYFRSAETLFDAISKRKADAIDNELVQFTVRVSVLEIYKERVRDLLNTADIAEVDPEDDSPGPHSLEIVHHPRTGYVYVQDVKEETVASAAELHAVLERGKKHRVIGVTNMNERSSRSHMVFLVSVVCKKFRKGEVTSKKPLSVTKSKLQLIDLAGSERASNVEEGGERLRETCFINKSLSALGDVMHALQNNDSRHIPFRNSKLTSLLRDSLGGQAKTLMMIQVNPSKKHMAETIRTLEFAQRVGKICLKAYGRKAANSGLDEHKSEDLEKLKRDKGELSAEISKLKKRVLGFRQEYDEEKHARARLQTALNNAQGSHEKEKKSWERLKTDLEDKVEVLERKLKQVSRRTEEEAKVREESGLRRSQQQASVVNAELKQLKERNADLRRKYNDAILKVEGLEKSAKRRASTSVKSKK